MSNQDVVREKYGSIARSVTEANASACCDPAMRCCDPITKDLYAEGEKGVLPEKAVLASLGCGNPTALIELKPGETVLDLGSGGGIDVLLSARRVGPTGKAYGLDMTDDMLALARENQRQAGATNVEFLKGEIENIPLPDSSVDVVISNCVINLSADKSRVLREAFRGAPPRGAASRSRMLSFAARFRKRCAKACCFGLAALPELWKRTTISQNFWPPASQMSILNQHALMTSKMRACS